MLLVLFRRFLGKRHSRDPVSNQESLEQSIVTARQGDPVLLNQLITDYQPYIAKVTSRFCRRYIDPSVDDEFSIALDAFNEAIHKFNPDSGRSFLGFAETVIRRRLIDYVRKEQKFRQQVPYSSFETEDEDDQTVNPVEMLQAVRRHEADQEAEARRLEIMEYSEELAGYGISFSELVYASPKHADSRRMLRSVARRLADSDELLASLRERGQLPIKQMLSIVDISRKTVERNRKYIIALTLVFAGNYPFLQDYLQAGASSEERSVRPCTKES